MRRANFSIRARLTLFVAVFVAIIIGLAGVAVTSLRAVDQSATAIDQQWFVGTQILGELSDRVSEFRLAEAYRALAPTPQLREEAERLAQEHRHTVDNLMDKYLFVLGERMSIDMDASRATWNAYLAEHDAWVKSDVDGMLDGVARLGSLSHQLYKEADDSFDRLIDANGVAAAAEVKSADRLVERAIIIVVCVSAASILLAAWLLVLIRRQITRPLSAMTQSLSRLAAGDRNVQVPELNRADEIGEMAKALDIFRGNALALEESHEATRSAQEHAQALARHDALTGLPNRRVFFADLEIALGHTENSSATYLVMIIDLDHFKQVNDLQGHSVGDTVLCEVARRLKDAVGRSDTVARLGGDEFAIIAEADQKAPVEGAIGLANKLLDAIRVPIVVVGGTAEVGASIGIASCPTDGTDAENLLRAADIAMYRAKKEGRDAFRFFEQSMDQELRAQAMLETDLKRAVAQGDILPYYQPLVDMREDRIYGFEILARWRHPVRGWVPPDTFIPIVERLGLITDLTSSTLRRACRDVKNWPKDIILSLNISPIQLRDPLLPAQLLTILNQEGFPPARLEVEVTETALVNDIEMAKSILTSLQSLGVRVALDDFGTGYSSLSHLRELKFDKVKIDRSFVQTMEKNAESQKIVDAILKLAQSLELPTVAEGIENPVVLGRLVDGGCEFGQGYYFGKAMSADDATEILTRGLVGREIA
jgi:diguanylate cyclase (GGDEF)-like protein